MEQKLEIALELVNEVVNCLSLAIHPNKSTMQIIQLMQSLQQLSPVAKPAPAPAPELVKEDKINEL